MYPGGAYPQQPYPQQGYPPPGYGPPGYPGQYPGQDQPSAPLTPPAPVRISFALYLLTALISLVTILLAINSDLWEQAIREAGGDTQGLDGVTVDTVVTIAKTVTITVGGVFLALYLLFAFKMRAGRNWARITLTVLSALSILSVSSTGSVEVAGRTYSSATSTIVGWVGVALAVGAIVLMYNSQSNAYFRAVKDRRQLRG